jgi:hypothetical protein
MENTLTTKRGRLTFIERARKFYINARRTKEKES